MLEGIVVVIVLLSAMEHVIGQTQDFEQECHILKVLDDLEDRLQKQETLVEQQSTLLQHQQTLLEQQTTRLREQEEEIVILKQPNTDCGVLYANGITQSGVYAIYPDKRSPFDVYCDMTDGGWTVIQRRTDGTVNFNRTWDEYVRGFGDVNGEYWLGLEKIHRLTKDGAEIYFDVENYDGTRDYAHYKNFTVNDATTLFKMFVDESSYSGSLPLFNSHNDMMFSTYDRDNDVSPDHCAHKYGGDGGWWYKGCAWLCHFNGVFGKKETGGLSCYSPDLTYVKTVTIKLKQGS